MVEVPRVLAVLKTALFALLLFACGPAATGSSPGEAGDTPDLAEAKWSGYPVVVEDDAGREVRIGARPERLGSMAPSVTETIFAVGAGDKVVGVTTADDYPPQVEDIEKIGGYREPSAEKVVALGIEVLFVSSDSATAASAEELEERTQATVVVLNPGSVDEAVSDIGMVGKVVGEPAEACVLEERLRKDLAEIEGAVAGKPEPTVFYELWDDPLRTVGPGGFVHDAIEVAGGRNIAADTEEAYPFYSEEMILKRDPDYYLVGSTTAEDVRTRPAYGSLTAVKKRRVIEINDDLISRPGPRIVEGVRQIAESIHPETFGERKDAV